MNRIKLQFYLVFILFFIIIQTTFAANVFWDGGGGDNLWTTPANWSDDNIPGSDDDVTIGISARVLLTGADGVAKSIIMNSGDTLEVASGFVLDVVEDVTIHGVLSLLGTAGINLGKDWIRTGVFNPNSSTVIFDEGTDSKIKTSETFYNLYLNKSGGHKLKNEDADAVKISVLNDLFLLSGLFEVKDLAGTDLDIDGDIIIAVDNDEALKLEDNSVDGISVELAGNLINNNANVNSIKDGNGSRIIFDGTGTQSITTAITLDGEVFENIQVQKPAGSLLNLTNNIQIEGDLYIQSGILKYNGNYITFGTDAADSVIVEGEMDIDNAASLQSAILRMAGGSNLIVNSGGILRVVGIAIEPAVVSGITGSFNFEINSGGTIQAQNYKFEYMDADGIELKDGAIIDPTYNFSNGTIDHIFPGGVGLNIGDVSGSNQRIIIRNASFPNNPGSGANNVDKSLSTDTLEFAKASGSFAGEEFDNDPNNLVEWSSALLTRIWTGQQNNRWAIAGNWSPSGIPADSENVIIPAEGDDPEINGNAACNDLLIRDSGFLTVLSGRNLHVNGNLSIGDTITQTDGRLVLEGSANLNVGGNYFKRNNARLIPNNSTIIFDGTEEQNISSGGVDDASDAFYNLTFNKSSGSALLLEPILINGNFNISSGTFNANGFDLSISNNWSNSGTFIHGGNTVNFIALTGGPFTITTGSSAFNHVLIDADNDANNYRLGSHVQLHGDLTISHGVLNATGYNLDVGGSLTNTKTFIAGSTTNVGLNWTNSGTFTAGSGTVIFDGSLDQTISTGGTGANRAFYNMVINKSAGTALLSSDLEVNGSLTMNNGTFNSGARNIFVAQNWRNAGTWVQTGGTVTFDATSGGPYTIGSSGAGGFHDIVLNANGLTYRLTSDIDINRNLTINAGNFQAQGNDLNVGGAWTNNGFFVPAGGTVIFDGAINQDINSGGTGFGKVFNHVTIQKSAGTLKINAPVKATGNFLINSGNFDMNNRNVNVAGSFVNTGVIDNAATLTLDALSGGPYNFSSGSSPLDIVTFNAPAITYNMNGNSIIYGNFTISAGNLIFNGYDLTFGDENSDLISVSGLLDIDAGASLSMFNGSSLTTNSGGVIRVVGAAGNLALVSEQSRSRFYNFTVASGASIHARYAKFEYMGSSGINVQTDASIDAVNNFSDVQFDNGQAGGSMLTVGDISGSNQRLDINNTAFLSNPGGGAFNVSHTSGSDTLNFIEAQGPFAGETFDNDNPGDNLILWNDLSITRVWDGSESSIWANPNNWTDGFVPADSEDAYIPAAGVSNEPNISGTERCRNLSISSDRTVTISNGATLDLGGYLHNNGTFTFGTSSILRIAGNFDNVHGTLNDNSSTVIFDSSLTQTIMMGGVGNIKRFYNLQINKSGGSVLLNSELEVNNNFNIVSGTFDANGYAMTIANNWTNSGSFLASGNLVTFDAQAAGPFTINSGGSPFHHILFDAGNDAYTHVLGSNLAATGNVNILHGVLNANGSNVDVDGNFNNSRTFRAGPNTAVGGDWTNTGTFTAGSGLVVFNGTEAQTIATGGTGANRAFNHFTVNKASGSAILSADLELNGNFSITSGTLNSAARNLFVAGSWINSGIWIQSGGRVTFDGTSGGPFTITSNGSGAFNHLTINSSSLSYQLGSDLNVDGDFILSAGTLQNQGNSIYLAGDWTNNATFTAAGGAVIFDGAGNQDINSGGTGAGKIFPSFICDKTGGDLKINAAIKLNGNLTVSNGIFDMNGRNVNLAGNFINNGIIDNPATVTLDATSGGPYNINGGISTLNILTINAPTVSYQLSGNTSMIGNLNITRGELTLNGQQLSFGNGADVISISGTLEVDAGAILAMADGSSLVVNSGGIVRLVGVSGNRATVTEQSASGSYTFTVGNGGLIHARQALLEYMDSNGINLQDGATIDIANNFSQVTFDHGQAGGTLFRVGNISGSNQLIEITAASFPTNPGGNAYNVTKTLSSDTLKFTSASGAFAGEDYDSDPAEPTGNLIQWGAVSNLRIWTGNTSTNWHTATNWSPLGVPADSENVEIGAAGNNPIIGIENAAARNITLFKGAILLLQNGYDLDINGDFVNGNGNLIVTSSNSTITTVGHWNNAGSFSHGNSSVTLSGISKQLLDGGGTGNTKAFNNLVIVNPDSVQLSGSLDIHGNLVLNTGVLYVNGQQIEFGDAAADVISVSGTLHLDDSSILRMIAGSKITVNAAGTLKVLGTSAATRPRITRLNSGKYTIEVYSGGTIDVSQAWIEYTGGSGIYVRNGANIHSTSKFDNVLFQNGTGSAYLTIENSQNLIMSGVQFDSAAVNRPTYNMNYLGTGSIDFSDYLGTMSGVNFENDNGLGIRGNVRWYFNHTGAVSSSVTFGNDLVITPAGNLGDITAVLVDQALPLAADSSVARYYTVEPSNGGMASIRLYYGEGELQSEVEQDLLIWRRRNGQWTMLGGNVYTSRNYVEIPGFNYDFIAGVKDTLILSDATDDTSLPVELVLFEAMVAGKNIVLQWQTASEIENARWYIERKILSRQEYQQVEAGELLLQNTAQDFIRLAGIEGQGSVSTLTEYEYIDENISLEFVYAYRLVDVSFNGEMTWHSHLMVVPPVVPGKFELVQNYPNPFNPETTIKFNLPVNARISLRIYNILGQRIKTLEDGEMPAGSYEVRWDGTNQNRQPVASGTYIYQISAKTTEEQQTFTQSKRMILMR